MAVVPVSAYGAVRSDGCKGRVHCSALASGWPDVRRPLLRVCGSPSGAVASAAVVRIARLYGIKEAILAAAPMSGGGRYRQGPSAS
jgi:hypothetical protein